MRKNNSDFKKALPIAAGILLGTSLLVSKCGNIANYAIDNLILGDMGTNKAVAQKSLNVELENSTGYYNKNNQANKYSAKDFKKDYQYAKSVYQYRIKNAKEEYSYDKEKMNELINKAKESFKKDLQEAKGKMKKAPELKSQNKPAAKKLAYTA